MSSSAKVLIETKIESERNQNRTKLKLKSNEYGDVDDDVAAMMVLNLVDFVVVDEYYYKK
jgi:hypothetical protein